MLVKGDTEACLTNRDEVNQHRDKGMDNILAHGRVITPHSPLVK